MPQTDNGWWWDTAAARIEEAMIALAIPKDTLCVTEDEARDAPASLLCEKLALLSYWIARLNRELAMVDTQLTLAKDTLEHSSDKLLAEDESKGAIGPRRAALISQNPRLRSTKIEVMESNALERCLRLELAALDIHWKTISRVLSARLKEPLE